MTLTDIAPVLAIVAIALALVTLALLFVGSRRVRAVQRAQRVVLGSRGDVDVVSYVATLDEKVSNLRRAVEDLNVEARDHEVRIDGCLSRVGMVRFDAYHDLGGRQSTVVAFLDARDNGMVITTVVSRDFARMYVKTIKDGQPDIPLAPEEVEAFDQARANAPFTVRPRFENARKEEEPLVVPEPESEPGSPESQAALRALERENRRRQRQGLPPLDDLTPPPSTLGWPKLEPLPPVELEEEAEDDLTGRPDEPDDHFEGDRGLSGSTKAGEA